MFNDDFFYQTFVVDVLGLCSPSSYSTFVHFDHSNRFILCMYLQNTSAVSFDRVYPCTVHFTPLTKTVRIFVLSHISVTCTLPQDPLVITIILLFGIRPHSHLTILFTSEWRTIFTTAIFTHPTISICPVSKPTRLSPSHHRPLRAEISTS